jgi:hypothetical protein
MAVSDLNSASYHGVSALILITKIPYLIGDIVTQKVMCQRKTILDNDSSRDAFFLFDNGQQSFKGVTKRHDLLNVSIGLGKRD